MTMNETPNEAQPTLEMATRVLITEWDRVSRLQTTPTMLALRQDELSAALARREAALGQAGEAEKRLRERTNTIAEQLATCQHERNTGTRLLFERNERIAALEESCSTAFQRGRICTLQDVAVKIAIVEADKQTLLDVRSENRAEIERLRAESKPGLTRDRIANAYRKWIMSPPPDGSYINDRDAELDCADAILAAFPPAPAPAPDPDLKNAIDYLRRWPNRPDERSFTRDCVKIVLDELARNVTPAPAPEIQEDAKEAESRVVPRYMERAIDVVSERVSANGEWCNELRVVLSLARRGAGMRDCEKCVTTLDERDGWEQCANERGQTIETLQHEIVVNLATNGRVKAQLATAEAWHVTDVANIHTLQAQRITAEARLEKATTQAKRVLEFETHYSMMEEAGKWQIHNGHQTYYSAKCEAEDLTKQYHKSTRVVALLAVCNPLKTITPVQWEEHPALDTAALSDPKPEEAK